MRIMLIGGNKQVYFLARLFISKGYQVTIINPGKDECSWLSRRLKAVIVLGDGSDPQILEESGARKADAILAVTPNDQDNLVICQLGSHQFKIPRILGLVNDPENESVFRQLGITAISTTRILADIIEQTAAFDDIINLTPAGGGKINITELVLGSRSPAVNKALKDINLPENALIASVLRKDETLIPRGSTVLHAQDRIVLITLPENHGSIIKKLMGKKS